VHTTCLSETIGDDIPQIIGKAKEEGKIPPGKIVIHTNTPSYAGSHVTGFSNMVASMVSYLSEPGEKRASRANIIPGWVDPRICGKSSGLLDMMDIDNIMFPDTSGVLDTPLTGKQEYFPAEARQSKLYVRRGKAKSPSH